MTKAASENRLGLQHCHHTSGDAITSFADNLSVQQGYNAIMLDWRHVLFRFYTQS
jgi:hypothetical protein